MSPHSPADAAISLAPASARALQVRALYELLERHANGKPWSLQELMIGFSQDVGYLGRLILAAEGTWGIDGDVTAELEHKLAESLWWTFVLADRLGIDISAAFTATMAKLDGELTRRIASIVAPPPPQEGAPASVAQTEWRIARMEVEALPGPTAVPPRTVVPVADVLAVGQGYTITLHAVADPAPPGPYQQPRAGFRHVAFDVTVTNTGPAPLGDNAGSFRVVASDGPGHLVFFRGVEPQLDTTGLGPGEASRGWVTFHVQAHAALTSLTYNPRPLAFALR